MNVTERRYDSAGKPQIAIILEGGLVAGIITSSADFKGLPVRIIDYDIEGLGRDQIERIEQGDDTQAEAHTRIEFVQAAKIKF